MPKLQLIIADQDLQHHEARLNWLAWVLVFLFGFLCGATADLSALWLFAHWMQP